jgi:heme A synthase
MAGYWFPILNETLVNIINNWRFDMDLPDVSFYQVLIHLTHRLGALIIFILMIVTHYKILHKPNNYSKTVKGNLYLLDFLVVVQIMLGAITIWTVKGPFITSFHVLNGAAVMGLCFLLLLRLSDLSFLKG